MPVDRLRCARRMNNGSAEAGSGRLVENAVSSSEPMSYAQAPSATAAHGPASAARSPAAAYAAHDSPECQQSDIAASQVHKASPLGLQPRQEDFRQAAEQPTFDDVESAKARSVSRNLFGEAPSRSQLDTLFRKEKQQVCLATLRLHLLCFSTLRSPA